MEPFSFLDFCGIYAITYKIWHLKTRGGRNVVSDKVKRSNLLLAIELIFFTGLCVMFLLDAAFGFIDEDMITPVHIVMVILVFEVYIMPFVIGKKATRDACFKWKYAKKYFQRRTPTEVFDIAKKRHVGGVIAIWIVVWLMILAGRLLGIITWELFMAGTCVLDMLNVWFVRKHCWLSTYVMKKSNCCAECTINGWDAWMFGSAFILCPTPNLTVFWVNIAMVITSLIIFLAWEISFALYPERFFKQTNSGIGCANCKTRKCRIHK